MVDTKEFIDFKSEVTEALNGRVEIEVMQTALEDIANETNTKMSMDKKDSEEMVRSLIKKFEERLEETASSSLGEIIEMKKAMTKKQDRNDTSAFEDILKRIRKEVEDCRKTVDIAYSEIHSKISVK
jgi:superfamily II helicase